MFDGAHREPDAPAEDGAVGFGGEVVRVRDRVGGRVCGGEGHGAAGGGEEVEGADREAAAVEGDVQVGERGFSGGVDG